MEGSSAVFESVALSPTGQLLIGGSCTFLTAEDLAFEPTPQGSIRSHYAKVEVQQHLALPGGSQINFCVDPVCSDMELGIVLRERMEALSAGQRILKATLLERDLHLGRKPSRLLTCFR